MDEQVPVDTVGTPMSKNQKKKLRQKQKKAAKNAATGEEESPTNEERLNEEERIAEEELQSVSSDEAGENYFLNSKVDDEASSDDGGHNTTSPMNREADSEQVAAEENNAASFIQRRWKDNKEKKVAAEENNAASFIQRRWKDNKEKKVAAEENNAASFIQKRWKDNKENKINVDRDDNLEKTGNQEAMEDEELGNTVFPSAYSANSRSEGKSADERGSALHKLLVTDAPSSDNDTLRQDKDELKKKIEDWQERVSGSMDQTVLNTAITVGAVEEELTRLRTVIEDKTLREVEYEQQLSEAARKFQELDELISGVQEKERHATLAQQESEHELQQMVDLIKTGAPRDDLVHKLQDENTHFRRQIEELKEMQLVSGQQRKDLEQEKKEMEDTMTKLRAEVVELGKRIEFWRERDSKHVLEGNQHQEKFESRSSSTTIMEQKLAEIQHDMVEISYVRKRLGEEMGTLEHSLNQLQEGSESPKSEQEEEKTEAMRELLERRMSQIREAVGNIETLKAHLEEERATISESMRPGGSLAHASRGAGGSDAWESEEAKEIRHLRLLLDMATKRCRELQDMEFNNFHMSNHADYSSPAASHAVIGSTTHAQGPQLEYNDASPATRENALKRMLVHEQEKHAKLAGAHHALKRQMSNAMEEIGTTQGRRNANGHEVAEQGAVTVPELEQVKDLYKELVAVEEKNEVLEHESNAYRAKHAASEARVAELQKLLREAKKPEEKPTEAASVAAKLRREMVQLQTDKKRLIEENKKLKSKTENISNPTDTWRRKADELEAEKKKMREEIKKLRSSNAMYSRSSSTNSLASSSKSVSRFDAFANVTKEQLEELRKARQQTVGLGGDHTLIVRYGKKSSKLSEPMAFPLSKEKITVDGGRQRAARFIPQFGSFMEGTEATQQPWVYENAADGNIVDGEGEQQPPLLGEPAMEPLRGHQS